MNQPALIYKITTATAFAPHRSAPAFPGMPLDVQDGFLHFSSAAQLPQTLRLYFAGQRDLLLLAVRTADLGEALVWEASRGGDLFPHLYAPLPLSAVAFELPIAVAHDGSCNLPASIK